MTGLHVWWVYLAPQNIPSANVLTLGNTIVLCCEPSLGHVVCYGGSLYDCDFGQRHGLFCAE